MAPVAVSAPLLILNLLAAAVWIGSLAALAVVTRTARQVLDPPAQVAFFRALGRRYAVVGGAALALAIATGGALIEGERWTAELTTLIVLTAALVLATGAGVGQARRVNRLRARQAEWGRAARTAGLLRATIAAITLAIVIDVALYLSN